MCVGSVFGRKRRDKDLEETRFGADPCLFVTKINPNNKDTTRDGSLQNTRGSLRFFNGGCGRQHTNRPR